MKEKQVKVERGISLDEVIDKDLLKVEITKFDLHNIVEALEAKLKDTNVAPEWKTEYQITLNKLKKYDPEYF